MLFEHKTYADDETGAVIHAKIPHAPAVPMDDHPAPQFFGVCEVEINAKAFTSDEFQIPGATIDEAFANFAEAHAAKTTEMQEMIAKSKNLAQQEKSRPKIIRAAANGVPRRFR